MRKLEGNPYEYIDEILKHSKGPEVEDESWSEPYPKDFLKAPPEARESILYKPSIDRQIKKKRY